MVTPAHQPGSVFDGRYRFEERIDDFGVGESWRARDALDGATVIVKLLPALSPSDRAAAGRFHDLGRALAATRLRGVLPTLRHGVAQGVPYLVHEFFAGVSLAKAFALARTGRHLLAPGALANLLDRSCEAIDAAHRASPPLVHGGLMPASLLAAMVAGRFDVRVLDFGLTPLFGDRLKIARATEYMAPSLDDDPTRATALDDAFALGTIVMEAVTDRRNAELGAGTVGNLSAVAKRRADVPAALMAVATRATRLDAKQRYADVAALRDALAAAWSPDARPTPDAPAAETPSGIAGVAAHYSSWVRFADADEASAIAPVSPVAAPPVAAFVSAPAVLSTAHAPAPPAAEELLGPTTKLPPKHALVADLGRTQVAAPHAPAIPAAPAAPSMPATQLLEQFDAPPPPVVTPTPYAPPAPYVAPAPYAPPAPYVAHQAPQAPQRMYGVAPPAYAPPVAPPPPRGRGALVAVAVVALIALALVLWFLVR